MSPSSAALELVRGRLAPSPTGHLHLGHARTFWVAWQSVRAASGRLVLRNEDLDRARARPEFVRAFVEDLHWLGLDWDEGPDVGGLCGPYNQSERLPIYRAAFNRLREAGCLFPCICSRKDILGALSAPHAADEEPVYPGTCRGKGTNVKCGMRNAECGIPNSELGTRNPELHRSWRFRVPDGETISFVDRGLGPQSFVAGRDFGDFIVWRADGLPSYQLAVVVDDAAMRISEVVRGADLLVSTARQLLLYRALGLEPPVFHHCPLLADEQGQRLAKRHEALSLRALRERGVRPEDLVAGFATAVSGDCPRIDSLSPRGTEWSEGERAGVRVLRKNSRCEVASISRTERKGDRVP